MRNAGAILSIRLAIGRAFRRHYRFTATANQRVHSRGFPQTASYPALDGREENTHIQNGLSDVVIEARGQVLLTVAHHGVGRKGDYRQVVQFSVVPNSPENFSSIH